METTEYYQGNPYAFFFSGSMLFVTLAIAVLSIIAYWKIFEKAGHPGWKALIPIYNIYIFTQIIGKPWWWVIMLIIPYVNVIFGIWGTNLLSKSFGKGIGFTLGLIFLSFIFALVLAFDRTIQYQGPAGNPSASVSDQIQSIGKDL